MALTYALLSPGDIARRIGKNSRSLRLSQNLSRKSLSLKAGVSESTIKRLETSGQVSLDALVLIASALGATQHLLEIFTPNSPTTIQQIRQPERVRGRK